MTTTRMTPLTAPLTTALGPEDEQQSLLPAAPEYAPQTPVNDLQDLRPLAGTYDINGAFNYLVNEKGMDRQNATMTVARDVHRRAGGTDAQFDRLVRERNTSPELILTYLTGARDVSDAAAFAEGFAREGIRSGTALAGAYAGGKLGFALTAPIPIPGTTVLGTTLGAIGGYLGGLFLGEKGQDFAVTPFTGEGQLVPSDMPVMEAGRTAGGAVASIYPSVKAMQLIPQAVNLGSARAVAQVAALRGRSGLGTPAAAAVGAEAPIAERIAQGVTLGGARASAATRQAGEKLLSGIGETARKAPVLTGAAELTPTAYMSVAGGASEKAYPGEALPRMASEAAIGVFMPHRVVLSALPVLKEASLGLASKVSRAGREQFAGDYIYRLVAALEDDPDAAIKMLQEEQLLDAAGEPIPFTPSQLTGSAAFSVLEAQLARADAKFGRDAARASRDGMQKISELINVLAATKDPNALKIAAELRKRFAEEAITARLDAATAQALGTVNAAVRGGQGETRDLNRLIYQNLTQALQDWRAAERAAYGRVDLTEEVVPNSTISTWSRIINEDLLPESPVPGMIPQFVSRISGQEVVDPLPQQIQSRLTVLGKEEDAAEAALRRFQRGSPKAVDEFNAALAEAGFSDAMTLEEQLRVYGRVADMFQTTGENRFRPDLPGATRKRVAQLAEKSAQLTGARSEIATLRQDLAGVPEPGPAEVPPITIGELKKFRTEMLDMARTAESQGNFRDARMYGQMAEAALDDIGVTAKRIEEIELAGGELTPAQRALVDAHTISRQGNDVFSRTFANNLMATDRRGANRIPPELLANRLFSGGSDATALKVRELQEAMSFLGEAGEEAAEKRLKGFNESINGLLRNMAQGVLETRPVVNPATGAVTEATTVNPRQLERFVARYSQILDLPVMAGLKSDLANAQKAENALKSALAEEGRAWNSALESEAFSKVLGTEDGVYAVSSALSKSSGAEYKPEQAFKRLIKLVNQVQGNETLRQNARAGLRNAVMDYAYAAAIRPDGSLDLQKYRDVLFKPVGRDQPSPMSMLRYGGVIDDDFFQNLNSHMNAFQRVENAKGDADDVADLLSSNDPMTALAVQVGGAAVARRFGKAIGAGGTVQIPGIGVRLASELFLDAPTIATRDILISASSPSAEGFDDFVRLYELGRKRASSKEQRGTLAQQFLGKVLGTPALIAPAIRETGEPIVPIEQQEEPVEIRRVPAPRPTTPVAPPQSSVTPPSGPPTTRGVAAAPSPIPPAPAPTPAPPQPAARARYAALFPNDPTSQMIQAQGIGSLMG